MVRLTINTEISSREFDANLLVACIFASRGNEVLIADQAHLNFLVRASLLPPSIFLTKSLHESRDRTSLYRKIIDRGGLLVSHDQESAVAYDANFVRKRYSFENMELVSKIYCWNGHELRALQQFFPNHHAKLVVSGSPRSDTWSQSFKGYWTCGISRESGTILFATNFTSVLGRNSAPLAGQTIGVGGTLEKVAPAFDDNLTARDVESLLVNKFLEILQAVSAKYPEKKLLLKPHPAESIASWISSTKSFSNVEIVKEGTLSRILRTAKVVIQSGSTAAIEASVARVPVITISNSRVQATRPGSEYLNQFGTKCWELNEVLQKLDEVISSGRQTNNSQALKSFFHLVPKEGLAAERIAKDIESLGGPQGSYNFLILSLAALIRRMAIRFGQLLRLRPAREPSDFKFPPIRRKELNAKVDWIANFLDLSQLQVTLSMDRRLVRVRPRNYRP